jgi:hypothetical protein
MPTEPRSTRRGARSSSTSGRTSAAKAPRAACTSIRDRYAVSSVTRELELDFFPGAVETHPRPAAIA